MSEPQPANVGIWKRFFFHPSFAVIAGIFSIIGVLSIPLDIYFYNSSIREPALNYYISPSRTPLVQKGTFNEFAVTFMGKPVDGNLSLMQIQFWNQGKQPIRAEDILKAITISPLNNQAIYKVVMTPSRPVLGAECSVITNAQSWGVKLSWKILERNDTIKLEILYGGSWNLPFVVDGAIVGQRTLTAFNVPADISLASHNFKPETAAVFVIFLLGVYMIYDSIKEFRNKAGLKFFRYAFLLIGIACLAFMAFYIVRVGQLMHILSAPITF